MAKIPYPDPIKLRPELRELLQQAHLNVFLDVGSLAKHDRLDYESGRCPVR